MDVCMIIMGSVTEVETERVHACEKQRLKHLRASERGANGCHDFCPSTTTHGDLLGIRNCGFVIRNGKEGQHATFAEEPRKIPAAPSMPRLLTDAALASRR